MSPRGLLVTLPFDSIAFRAVVASIVAVLLARLLLRASLRQPKVRVFAALLPALALVGVLVLDAGQWSMPTLMVPVDSGHQLAVPIQEGYLHFGPAAIPILLGTWLLVAGWRIARRTRSHLLAVRAARAAAANPATARVRRVTARAARRLGVAMPDVAVGPDVSGGAAVIGIRHPVLLLDEELVDDLDPAELRGVIAHELAHVARRDNLIAFAARLIGDLVFFVPGRKWTLRRLCAEREFAADQLATSVTKRPGALASGLLKAMSRTPASLGAAALVDGVTVVRRVEILVEPAPAPGRLRGGAERATVVIALALVLVGAVAIPRLAGSPSNTDALAILWRSGIDASETTTATDARVFDVYRGVTLTSVPTPTTIRVLDDDPWDFHPGAIHACADHGACPDEPGSLTLGLRPRPLVRIDTNLTRRWTAEHVVGNDGGVSVLRLTRME